MCTLLLGQNSTSTSALILISIAADGIDRDRRLDCLPFLVGIERTISALLLVLHLQASSLFADIRLVCLSVFLSLSHKLTT